MVVVHVPVSVVASLYSERSKLEMQIKFRFITNDPFPYLSRVPYPKLTTIVQPIDQLADACVNLLIDRIQGKPADKKCIQLEVTLREGDSTKPFPPGRGK